MFVSDIEMKNPEALIEIEGENLRKQIGQYNQGLASACGALRTADDTDPEARER